MAVNIRPLHDYVIVERKEEQEGMIGGLYLPDTAKEKPQQGVVIRVGAGRQLKDGTRTTLDVKEGDTILFGKYGGNEVKIDGKEYLILGETEILAILSE